MVDLNAHEAGNGGKKPREAYSLPSLLYSEWVCRGGRYRPALKWNKATHSPSQGQANSGTTGPLFTIAHPSEKKVSPAISGDASYLHEDKGKSGAFSGSEPRRRDVTSEASSPLVQELGGRVSVRLRSVALRVRRGKQPLRQCCRARAQILLSSSGIEVPVIPYQRNDCLMRRLLLSIAAEIGGTKAWQLMIRFRQT
jgi:hypothetical protein